MVALIANLTYSLLASGTILGLLGCVPPARAVTKDSRALPKSPPNAFETTIVSKPSPPRLLSRPPFPSIPTLDYTAIPARILERARRTRTQAIDAGNSVWHTLCGRRPPFSRSRFAPRAYYALFRVRLELCGPQSSIIDSLPRMFQKSPARRPRLAMPILPPPPTRSFGSRQPTRLRPPATPPKPAHHRPRIPRPTSDESTRWHSPAPQELRTAIWATWVAITEHGVWRPRLSAYKCFWLVVATFILGFGIEFLDHAYGGFLFLPRVVPCPPPALLEKQLFVDYTHKLTIFGYREFSSEPPFLDETHFWGDYGIFSDKKMVETRAWHVIDQTIAEYKARYGHWDDAVFEVQIVRGWIHEMVYTTADGIAQVEVPRADCEPDILTFEELTERVHRFDHVNAWSEDRLWSSPDSPTPSPPGSPTLEPEDARQPLDGVWELFDDRPTPWGPQVVDPEADGHGVNPAWLEDDIDGLLHRHINGRAAQ